jgi:phage I-like protein
MHRTHLHNIGIAVCQIDLDGLALSEIQLTPDGLFRAKDGRPSGLSGWRVDAHSVAALKANFAQTRDKRVIDYDHATLYTQQTGNKAPAAAWFDSIDYRPGKGVVALGVEWTAEAKADIEAKKYRYISPVIAYDQKTGAVTNILMAALTNVAALDGMDDLTARAAAHFQFSNTPEKPSVDKATLALLGLAENAAPETIAQAVAALKAKADQATTKDAEIAALKAQTPDPAEYAPVAALTAMQSEIAALKSAQSARDIDDLVKPALADGRLLPAQETWARDLGKSNIAALKQFIDSAQPIAALKGAQTGGKQPGVNASGLSDEEVAVCSQLGLSHEEFLKNRGK